MDKKYIKDINSLNNLNNDILNLKKIIEDLPEIKELKKLQEEEKKLENIIINYSTYNTIEIGNIITKLMTIFEKTDYHFIKNTIIMFWDCDYYIEPKSREQNIICIHPNYKIKNIKENNIYLDSKEKKEKCYLQPSNFNQKNSTQNKIPNYIQAFIDYLYEKRSSKKLEEINKKELEIFLEEFLNNSIKIQQERQNEIEEKAKKIIQIEKRKEFEDSCLIDRNLILTTIAYIINHYEKNMTAKLEKREEWSYGNQWSELTSYQILTIDYNDREISLKAIIDSIGCYPDEEYCINHTNMNKHTNICFYDVKNRLQQLINNSTYLYEFMNNIEKLYLEKKDISQDDIHKILVNISNNHKTKQKKLTNK